MENKDLYEIIDSRIKELFKEGVLTVCLVEETDAYSDSVSRSIEIRWNEEVLHSMSSEDKFMGL